MALYRWIGRKPFRRHTNRLEPVGRSGRTRVIGVQTVEITRHDPPFEPTAAELQSFGDLLELVGAGLHLAEPLPVPVEAVTG